MSVFRLILIAPLALFCAFTAYALPEPTIEELKTKAHMIVHSISGGDAILIRTTNSETKTYTIKPFTDINRQQAKNRPTRLVTLDGDIFYSAQGASARVSIYLNGTLQLTPRGAAAINPLILSRTPQTFNRNFRESLSTDEIRRLRALVYSAQSSRPLTNLTAPQVVLPREKESFPSGQIPFYYWTAGKNNVRRVEISVPTSSDEKVVASQRVTRQSLNTIAVDREVILNQLASEMEDKKKFWDYYESNPVKLRLKFVFASGDPVNVEIFLPNPAKAKVLNQSLGEFQSYLRHDHTTERDFHLIHYFGLFEQGAGVSTLMHLLATSRRDAGTETLLRYICEQNSLAWEFFKEDD